MEEEAQSFLGRFVDEFPAALEEDSPLPVSPLSRKVSLEELHGESLELGLRLLTARYDWKEESHPHKRRLSTKYLTALVAAFDSDSLFDLYNWPHFITKPRLSPLCVG